MAVLVVVFDGGRVYEICWLRRGWLGSFRLASEIETRRLRAFVALFCTRCPQENCECLDLNSMYRVVLAMWLAG